MLLNTQLYFLPLLFALMQNAKFAAASCFASFRLGFWESFNWNEVILSYCIAYYSRPWNKIR